MWANDGGKILISHLVVVLKEKKVIVIFIGTVLENVVS